LNAEQVQRARMAVLKSVGAEAAQRLPDLLLGLTMKVPVPASARADFRELSVRRYRPGS